MTGECYNYDKTIEKSRSAVAKGGAASMNQRSNDPRCPLKKIWCIVGAENVWANIQAEDNPVLLDFNLNDSKCWSKFLTDEYKRIHFGGSVQASQPQATKLEYAPPLDSRIGTRELERQINKFLTGKFEDERIAQVKKTTNWNLSFGDEFRGVLLAEQGAAGGRGQEGRHRSESRAAQKTI